MILHGEIEARYLSAKIPRLFEYNRLLSMRYDRPVHTVVVYPSGGPPGVQRNEFRVESLGQTITAFRYHSLGLSRGLATQYLARPSPLTWALAAVMRPGRIGSRAELRLACLRRIIAARDLEEEQRFLLFNFVASYIESDRGVSEEYDELFKHRDNRKVHEMMMTWAEKIEAKGYEKGQQEGRRQAESMKMEGLEQGRREGEAALLDRQMTHKFGPLSESAQRQIEKC